jgi:hypothetical protein
MHEIFLVNTRAVLVTFPQQLLQPRLSDQQREQEVREIAVVSIGPSPWAYHPSLFLIRAGRLRRAPRSFLFLACLRSFRRR